MYRERQLTKKRIAVISSGTNPEHAEGRAVHRERQPTKPDNLTHLQPKKPFAGLLRDLLSLNAI